MLHSSMQIKASLTWERIASRRSASVSIQKLPRFGSQSGYMTMLAMTWSRNVCFDAAAPQQGFAWRRTAQGRRRRRPDVCTIGPPSSKWEHCVVTLERAVALQAKPALHSQPIPRGLGPALPSWGISLPFPAWKCVAVSREPTL